jgi:hypothetical protein
MKKKHIVMLLLAIGVSLLILSVVLSCIAMRNVSIIGGAGWPTFWFVFTTRNGGLYYLLARLGIYFLLAGGIVALIKKKNQ